MLDPWERPKRVVVFGAPVPVNVVFPRATVVTLTTVLDRYTHAPTPIIAVPYESTPHRCARMLVSLATIATAGGGEGGEGGVGGGEGGEGGGVMQPVVALLASDRAHALASA